MTATVTLNLPTGMQIGLALEFPDETLKPLGARSLRSVMTFSAGMGYIIATPLSTAIGRRPVVLIASATVTLMTLWAAMAGNFYQLMAATCVQGISGGATFAVAILIIVDATFIHERPYAFAVFWAFGTFFVNCLHMALPFFLKPSVLWRPVYLAWCGGLLAVFIISYCFIPETYFIRPAVALNGRVLVQSSTEKVRIYDSWEAVPCGPDCPHNHDETPGPSDWALRRQIERAPGTQWESGLVVYAQMLLCMCNPLLVWVSLLSATILSGVIFTTLMLEGHFEHNLPHDEVRMSGVYRGAAAIIGSLLAIPASGPLISLSIRYFTLRNGGTRHAEVYLPGFRASGALERTLQVLLAMGSSSGGSAVLYYVSYGLCMFSYVSGRGGGRVVDHRGVPAMGVGVAGGAVLCAGHGGVRHRNQPHGVGEEGGQCAVEPRDSGAGAGHRSACRADCVLGQDGAAVYPRKMERVDQGGDSASVSVNHLRPGEDRYIGRENRGAGTPGAYYVPAQGQYGPWHLQVSFRVYTLLPYLPYLPRYLGTLSGCIIHALFPTSFTVVVFLVSSCCSPCGTCQGQNH
ncbi:conserved hypothetical protein [Verticillium alfalfae VaMs.102]|uniref:Major facilitator superfamily (MFS) profile domain-containing protein n=1 Tax=Verticillium alfalfae (strain VaMs.102 / ATCC MYA-4576 / FGSC 10136) TaxID=526221 RepID=C9SV28_VERA1|nr:conserved hypothetical protein [Verticillium alfalfae VaMs.102]EEY22643.1 conserved hypothetical protein [Verticillium alfalfae VaMs.102]